MQDYKNSIGHLEKLKRRREALQAIKDAIPKPPSLHEQIESWFAKLSQEDQKLAYKMLEFKEIFPGESPQRIGAALFDLGWTRRRSWTDSKPTARYWMKLKE